MPGRQDDAHTSAEGVSDQVGPLDTGRIHGSHDVAGKVVGSERRTGVWRFMGAPGIEEQAPEAGGQPTDPPRPGPAVRERARDQDEVGPAPDQLEIGGHETHSDRLGFPDHVRSASGLPTAASPLPTAAAASVPAAPTASLALVTPDASVHVPQI